MGLLDFRISDVEIWSLDPVIIGDEIAMDFSVSKIFITAQLKMFARALLDGDGLVAPGRATARTDAAGFFQTIRFRARALHLGFLAILKIWHKQDGKGLISAVGHRATHAASLCRGSAMILSSAGNASSPPFWVVP